MKSLKFGGSFVLLLGLIYLGNTYGALSPRLPGVATFLNPFSGVWQQADPKEPSTPSVVISADVDGEVVIDQRGIAHVFAADQATAVYLQGYLHARDRLFQMEIATRAAGGRLAEVLGPGMLSRDRIQRRKGMRVAAQRTADAWLKNPESAETVNAYCAGINAFLAQLRPEDYPVEFKLLGFAPEAWTPLKSALLSKSMAETLCFRHYDIAATNARALLGDSLFQHLYPDHNPAQSPVITSTPWVGENTFNEDGTIDAAIGEVVPFPELAQSPEGIGSNNWALAGSKTASGFPLLSNDPHLSLSLPSIWYEIHLVYGDKNVYGVSLPALPGVLIGFNETSAWGITNVGQDVADWYKINWVDTTHQQYWLDGEKTDVAVVFDTIAVRGAEEIVVATPWTVFGPVVYDDQPEEGRYNLALRWAAHDAPFREDADNVEAFLDLANATDLEGYLGALSAFDNPGSNIVYANQANDIALTVTGHFPVRRPQQGRFVQDGSTLANAWSGFIPYQDVPRDTNPERQFVASANQRSAALSYPYYYLGSFDDYRGRYLNRHLESVNNARPEDMMALQYDAYSLRAEEATPILLAALSVVTDQENTRGVDLLKAWDFVYRAESQAPIVFDSWLDSLYKLTFDEIYSLHEENRPVMFPETWRFLDLLRSTPKDPIFDYQGTPERETANDLILRAYGQAMEAIAPILEKGTTWSEHRGTRIEHLARIPGFASALIHSDGARETPNALASDFGPSWRMVVSLEKPLRAWGVLPGGASGNVGSPFYTEGIEEWSRGDYFELKLYSTPDEVPTRERLTIRSK